MSYAIIPPSCRGLRAWGSHLKALIDDRVNNFGPQFLAFSLFGLINYPVFYIIWIFVNEQSYESLALRLSATLLCLGLFLRNQWPESLRKWLPLYWYLTLSFCLPFFFTYMLLHNPESKVWIMGFTSVIFWLVLLVDLASAFALLFLGTIAALILFIIYNDSTFILPYFLNISSEYLGCLVVIGMFATNKVRFEQSRLQTAATIGTSLAHELRTPLSAIDMGIEGAKKYFPILLQTYQQARQEQLPNLTEIPPQHFEVLLTLFDDLQRETHFSNVFIDMLLYNANQSILNQQQLSIKTIGACIREALQRYPFTDAQEGLVEWTDDQDFEFRGSELLLVHALFNLLKNALYQIEKAGKGHIHIWQTLDQEMNILHFKDTATGIPVHLQNKLFQRFVSQKHNGTGLGLAFCKMVLQGLGGDIQCHSREGEFTEFQLFFPKIPKVC